MKMLILSDRSYNVDFSGINGRGSEAQGYGRKKRIDVRILLRKISGLYSKLQLMAGILY